ncbi:hypothetical protein ACFL7D_03090 [candidate division KSB1 bacterium]
MKRSNRVFQIFIVALAFVTVASVVSVQAQLKVYGYFATRYEDVFGEPSWDGTKVVEESMAGEWATQSFNLMMQHQVSDKIKVYVNLAGEDLELKNYWGEYTMGRFATLRIGQTYRKFGLYNEILDAVPTYYGIEPPELFDSDHLIVSRTSTVMVHGAIPGETGVLNYSVSTDNGEGGATEDNFPLGFDMNYNFGGGDHKIGISGYTTGGATTSDKSVGEGSPKTGVLPWMAEDEFNVFGFYGETYVNNFTFQFAFWQASHSALRDPGSTVTMLNGAGLIAAKQARFLVDDTGGISANNIDTNGDYDVQTWYFRSGYSVDTEKGEFAPYFQWDYYKNPETIGSKSLGGDNEAGVADDGIFTKGTAGIIFRPQPQIAIKLDGSMHFYKFHGENVNYPEVRFDISYLFGDF